MVTDRARPGSGSPEAQASAPPAAISEGSPLFEARFRAISARDIRFDGQFISGVHSTGIYCRPSCPAATPKPGNVTFYRTAAAAHDAGLRACKRCQPDAVPGSPEWNLRDDLASRAMRLIADGTVEREGVPGLADRLGYTPRHLGRVLASELGAGPLALARAHRAQTARTLLTSTDLPVADVAFAAGFASIRQFNETLAAVYERTPSELRRAAAAQRGSGTGRADAAAPGDSGMVTTPASALATVTAAVTAAEPDQAGTVVTLRLPTRAPFDGPGMFRFLADHAILGIETALVPPPGESDPSKFGFARRLRLPHSTAFVELSLDAQNSTPGADATTAGIACTARLENVADLSTLVARLRRMFDLDADSQAIDSALSDDPVLAASVRENPGARLPGSVDAEETLFRTLVGQQISVAAARTVLGRVAAELTGDSGLFPTAEQFADRGHEVLRGPASRIRTIIGAAEALVTGRLTLDLGMTSAELMSELTALPGIGPWTAGYVTMRVLGSPDILLSSDLIMLQSAGRVGLPDDARGLAIHGERWSPWRSYAGLHLWKLAGR